MVNLGSRRVPREAKLIIEQETELKTRADSEEVKQAPNAMSSQQASSPDTARNVQSHSSNNASVVRSTTGGQPLATSRSPKTSQQPTHKINGGRNRVSSIRLLVKGIRQSGETGGAAKDLVGAGDSRATSTNEYGQPMGSSSFGDESEASQDRNI